MDGSIDALEVNYSVCFLDRQKPLDGCVDLDAGYVPELFSSAKVNINYVNSTVFYGKVLVKKYQKLKRLGQYRITYHTRTEIVISMSM